MSDQNKWVYSMNDQDFNSEAYDSKKEAIKYGTEDALDSDISSFSIGQVDVPLATDFVDAENIIGVAYDRATMEIGEYADDWLSDVNQKEKDELNSLIAGWFEKTKNKPNFYRIVNIEKITLSGKERV